MKQHTRMLNDSRGFAESMAWLTMREPESQTPPCNINKGKFAVSYCYANTRSPVYFREKIFPRSASRDLFLGKQNKPFRCYRKSLFSSEASSTFYYKRLSVFCVSFSPRQSRKCFDCFAKKVSNDCLEREKWLSGVDEGGRHQLNLSLRPKVN